MPAHQFRWETLISDQFDGELIPVLISDRMQTVALGLFYDLLTHRITYFEDYEGNELEIYDFVSECIQRLIIRKESMPVGSVIALAAANLPDGYLYCNGDEVLKADYPELWNTIGTLWGTATLGSDYFVLPDFRDTFLLGFMQGGGSPAFGTSGGAKTHTLTTNEMPAHNHALESALTGSSTTHLAWAASFGNDTPNVYKTYDEGGGAAHNNMPPYKAVNYIIFTGKLS